MKKPHFSASILGCVTLQFEVACAFGSYQELAGVNTEGELVRSCLGSLSKLYAKQASNQFQKVKAKLPVPGILGEDQPCVHLQVFLATVPILNSEGHTRKL